MAIEPRVLVPCDVCEIEFDVSARTHRNIVAGRSEARCVIHRQRRPRPATVQASHRRYWLKRYTMDEIKQMAWAIFDVDELSPGKAHASPALMALASASRSSDRTRSPRELDPRLVERATTARRRVASGA